jgi:hypothetical protein
MDTDEFSPVEVPPRSIPPLPAPPPGQYYHGVYPGGITGWEDDISAATLDAYLDVAGRAVAWVYFSHNWFNGSAFPKQTASLIRQRGSIPFIRLMLRSRIQPANGPDPRYSLQAILSGHFDRELDEWGRAAANFGNPLLVEWGTEMNGEWFHWNARWNCGGNCGTRRFRRAYRYIVSRIRMAGAENITWVFHVNATDVPDRPWNLFERYYPGNDVVDWLGISAYGPLTPLKPVGPPFAQQIESTVDRLLHLAPDKPIFLLEFGSAAGHPVVDQARWANDALSGIADGRWPRLRGFSWWNEHWRNDGKRQHDTDMRVQNNPRLAEVFRRQLERLGPRLDHPGPPE